MFTYGVEWHSSQVRWASRWDPYLAMSDVQIHWFSIINSVVVVFFLAGTYAQTQTTLLPGFPHLLESFGFFGKISRPWRVLENGFCPGKSWKF